VEVNKTLLLYPKDIYSQALDPRGSSGRARRFLENAREMRVVGKVKRFAKDKVRNSDDPFFAEFVRSKFGASPSKIFTKYGLAQPNLEAGYQSLIKYDKPQPTLQGDLWALAGTWAEKHFMCMANSEVWEDYDYVKSELDMKASSGFPWNVDENCRSKGEFYARPDAEEFIENYFERLAQPYCPPVFWTNNVKEEIRSAEKMAQNKLRTFVGSPIEHVHACTQMFGDMNEKYYSTANMGHHWSFVGSTKFYRGWTKLFKRLSKHPNAFELDESEFDSSLFREAMYGMAELRFRMLAPEFQTEENRNRIWNLYVEIVDSVIITQDGDVVTKNTGNPSGSANTIVDNTIILFRLLAYAWLVLCREHGREGLDDTYTSFMENVEAALNGDDNTWTCSDYVVGWYNALNISKIWSAIGVTTKSDVWAPRKLIECSFLSHSFRQVGADFVPIPEGEKVLCSMAYHLKSATPRWSLLRACALRIESFWDDQCREVLSQYIQWLCKEYSTELHADKDPKDKLDMFTFQEVYSVYKTDSEIKMLYLSEEGSYDGLVDTGKDNWFGVYQSAEAVYAA